MRCGEWKGQGYQLVVCLVECVGSMCIAGPLAPLLHEIPNETTPSRGVLCPDCIDLHSQETRREIESAQRGQLSAEQRAQRQQKKAEGSKVWLEARLKLAQKRLSIAESKLEHMRGEERFRKDQEALRIAAEPSPSVPVKEKRTFSSQAEYEEYYKAKGREQAAKKREGEELKVVEEKWEVLEEERLRREAEEEDCEYELE